MRPLPIIDLDGVFADFNSGACAVHGKRNYAVTRWSYYEDWGYSEADFWYPIKNAGYEFYGVYVPPYPWADELLTLIQSYGDFVIATANPLDPGLAASKTDWIKKHLGDVDVMMGSRKELLAMPGRVLLDDYDTNIDKFRARGGRAVTFPQAWNKLHGMTKHRMAYVRDSLDFFMGDNKAA